MTYTEPSNEYVVENALPMKDEEGMNATNYSITGIDKWDISSVYNYNSLFYKFFANKTILNFKKHKLFILTIK